MPYAPVLGRVGDAESEEPDVYAGIGGDEGGEDGVSGPPWFPIRGKSMS